MSKNSFIILVVDCDPVVEVVSARILSAALDTERISFSPQVRVLSTQEEIIKCEANELPESVRAIQQNIKSASSIDIEQAKLVVGFAGLNMSKLEILRNVGVASPAVNLCQFVMNLEDFTKEYVKQENADVGDVIVSAAMQFGINFGLAKCEICEDKVQDSIDYWINIADSCSKFAQIVQTLQK